jgi:hypothetical protein
MRRVFIQKCFMFTVGSFCRVKGFTTGSSNSLRDVRKSQMMTEQVRKWLRNSRDFYAVGFDALVKRLDNCINVRGDMSRNRRFSQVRVSHVLGFISICDRFTDSP